MDLESDKDQSDANFDSGNSKEFMEVIDGYFVVCEQVCTPAHSSGSDLLHYYGWLNRYSWLDETWEGISIS